MGNLFGSSGSKGGPSPPPPLMAPSVIGDHAQFMKILSSLEQEQTPDDADEATALQQRARRRSAEMLMNTDSQGNNALHAVCASPPSSNGIFILKEIITTVCSSVGDGLASKSPAQLLSLVQHFSAKNQIGCSPVWLCCGYGNHKLLEAMFQGLTLHSGNEEERHRLVRDLLSSANSGGDTAVLAACSRGHTDTLAFVVDMLKMSEGGADATAEQIQKMLTQPNKAGSTPLFAAVGSSNSKCVDLLLSMLGSQGTYSYLLSKNRLGLTPLHIACERDSGETVTSLLAPLLARVGDTRLQKLRDLTTDIEMEHLSVLTALLSARDANNATPLMLASFLGNMSALAALQVPTLACKTSGSKEGRSEDLIDATDGGGRTAYYLAKAALKDEAADILARKVEDGGFGANIEIKDSFNISAQEAGMNSKKAKEERDRIREEGAARAVK